MLFCNMKNEPGISIILRYKFLYSFLLPNYLFLMTQIKWFALERSIIKKNLFLHTFHRIPKLHINILLHLSTTYTCKLLIPNHLH